MDKTQINLFLILSFFIIITMMSGLFYFIFQFRKRKIQEELDRLISIHDERERIIRDLHDELGGNLSSILLISDLILKKNLDEEKLYECIEKISGTSRNISQQIKTVIWSLDSEKDSLYNLVEYIKQYATQFFEITDIQLKIVNHYDYGDIYVSGLFRKNTFLALKEAMNNVAKHAKATAVNIDIKISDNRFYATISDNGISLKNENTLGNGLLNMKKRMAEINGGFSISNGRGTCISLSAPLV